VITNKIEISKILEIVTRNYFITYFPSVNIFELRPLVAPSGD